jgi:ribulose-5-phosphate 4-epimerase/fuculose-1-phosphate aldolase
MHKVRSIHLLILSSFPSALILQNHGILTAGETIESAVAWFIMLERHCQVMLMADAAAGGRGQKPIVVDDEEAAFTHGKTGTETAGHFMSTPYFNVAKRSISESEKHEFPLTFGL